MSAMRFPPQPIHGGNQHGTDSRLQLHPEVQQPQILFDYEYDGETFDIKDKSQPFVKDQILDKLCPEPTEEELEIKPLAHFAKENPRYVKIIRLSLQGMSIDDIRIEILGATSLRRKNQLPMFLHTAAFTFSSVFYFQF